MSQEDKQLLLKVLCAMLPYGVKCVFHSKDGDIPSTIIRVDAENEMVANRPDEQKDKSFVYLHLIEHIKPYLRPMSSMIEEEKENLQSLHDIISDENYGDGYSPSAWDAITEWEDYCNSRHLDFRGLIEKGLALEAPEGMY